MDPKKPKELIAEFCQLKGYDESVIQTIVDECYSEVRRCMESLDYDYLQLPGIGDAFLKAWSVKREQLKLQSLMDAHYLPTQDVPKWEKLTMVYNRMTNNFYKETNRSIDRMMEHDYNKHKHNYDHIEGHEYTTYKPGTKTYTMGCRCETCKACMKVYRKAYNLRKKANDTESETATGMG